MEPPFAGKFRSICKKKKKDDFWLLSKPMLFRFNSLTLLANIFSLQFTEISENQPSSSYRASKSRFFPYIHGKFCRICPTTKMTYVCDCETFYSCHIIKFLIYFFPRGHGNESCKLIGSWRVPDFSDHGHGNGGKQRG